MLIFRGDTVFIYFPTSWRFIKYIVTAPPEKNNLCVRVATSIYHQHKTPTSPLLRSNRLIIFRDNRFIITRYIPHQQTNMSNLDHLQKRCEKKKNLPWCLMNLSCHFRWNPKNHKQNFLAFFFSFSDQVELPKIVEKLSRKAQPFFTPPTTPFLEFLTHPWHLPFWTNGTCCRRLSLLSKDSEARRFTVLSRGSALR